MRRRGSGIAGNPVLIGAATMLVVIVAVFLAYNANQGLPFVPTYELNAEVPSAANLVRGNEVRIGGSRVGVVDRSRRAASDDGTSDRGARPQARQARSSRCRATRRSSSARARRSASSTSRSRAGTSQRRLRRTAPRSR